VKAKNQVEFQILGETEDFLAADKPAGLLTHPTKPGGPRTLWDELRALLSYELAIGGQVALVNRLDRETSGVLLVAKTTAAARAAGIAMQNGRVQKEYLALVFGWPKWHEMTIEAPIARRGEVANSEVWVERVVHPRGVRAITRVRVEQRLELTGQRRFSLLKAWPETGRTHQVRVHLSHVGFPLLGDKIYARGSRHYLDFIARGWTKEMESEIWLSRHALHSSRLGINIGERKLEWTSPLSSDLTAMIELSESSADFICVERSAVRSR
jgi:23S rRNA pseudouridine1911/1915/1917 synthase